jgi:hypothetical protein
LKWASEKMAFVLFLCHRHNHGRPSTAGSK